VLPAEQRNQDTIIELYGSLATRAYGRLQRLVSNDVVLEVAGNSRFAGKYAGAASVIALAARLNQRFVQGASELNELYPAADSVRATVTVTVGTFSGHTLRARLLETFDFGEDGLVSSIWVAAGDQDEVDRFLDGYLTIAPEPSLG
jgi:ketosteroid isomerase-like protein